MIKKLHTLSFTLLILSTVLTACESDYTTVLEPQACDKISYQQDIAPIFASKCSACHNTGSKNGDFSAYDKLGPWLQEIRVHALIVKNMPPKDESPLSSKELGLLQCWFNSGTPDN